MSIVSGFAEPSLLRTFDLGIGPSEDALCGNLHCHECNTGVCIWHFKDEYYKKFTEEPRWFDRAFVDAFCSMLMHNAHIGKSATNAPTPYVFNCQHMTEDFSYKDVQTITTNKKVITGICWSSSHFVVVEFVLMRETSMSMMD